MCPEHTAPNAHALQQINPDQQQAQDCDWHVGPEEPAKWLESH